jgi:hypothetical protein
MEELRNEDLKAFINYTRMKPDLFFWFATRLKDRLTKQRTNMKKPISADHRLAVALRYFAGGDMYKSMSYAWAIAPNTISLIVKEVAEAIVAEFGEEHLAPPTTPDEWKEVANKFQTKWNFPHVLGALDGKHVAIEKPRKSGSKYFNYKKFFSIIMLALVDADYKFLWVNAGVNGACSDAQIWNDCDLHDLFKFGIGIPPKEPLDEEEDFELPYYLIGDDAFALRTYLMKPYGHRTLTKEERIFFWYPDTALQMFAWYHAPRPSDRHHHCAGLLHPAQHAEVPRHSC